MLRQKQGTPDVSNRPQNLVSIVREVAADLESPISAYLKLADKEPSFLLESVTGGEQVARYSFIGVNPSAAFVLRGQSFDRNTAEGVSHIPLPEGSDPLDILRHEMAQFQPAPTDGLPRFAGGLVGYLGYETAGRFESRLDLPRHDDIPEAIFMLADNVVAFDHAFGRVLLIANAYLDGDEAQARAEAEARLDVLEARLSADLPTLPVPAAHAEDNELRSNLTKGEFRSAVLRAKEEIAAGEIFQAVLSQRFERQTSAAPFAIYRALRRLNPSPYMFFLDFGDLAGDPPMQLIGASPEMHVRLESGIAAMRPIAGTRPRGGSTQEDEANEKELLSDPKERAEHVMLVDLARNDLGRVCSYGSVSLGERMGIERYSHVMHIVSHVEGKLRPEFDGFDLMRATFPAGTVSGAPKIRAMEIIAELEGQARGPYAGAVGYFSYDGSLDTCITIRTLIMRGKTISVQAGAGIVADSDPEREYEETANKARALVIAVDNAETDGQA